MVPMPAPPMPLPSMRPREGPAMWLPSNMSSPSCSQHTSSSDFNRQKMPVARRSCHHETVCHRASPYMLATGIGVMTTQAQLTVPWPNTGAAPLGLNKNSATLWAPPQEGNAEALACAAQAALSGMLAIRLPTHPVGSETERLLTRHLRGDSSHKGLKNLSLALRSTLLNQRLEARGQAVQAVVAQQRHAVALRH